MCVAIQQAIDSDIPRETPRVGERPPAQFPGIAGQQRRNRIGPPSRVMAVDETAAESVGDRHGQAADRGRHHRRPAGLGLDGHQSEGFRVAGYRDEVGGAVHVDQLFARLRGQESHPIGDAQVVSQADQAVRLGQPAARYAAGDDHPDSGQ